jgi:uncharacterized DUF497 family protein
MPLESKEQPAKYRFEWDENKNRQNIRKHGFDFADSEEMFDGIPFSGPTLEKTTEKAAGLESVRRAVALQLSSSLNANQIRFVSFL